MNILLLPDSNFKWVWNQLIHSLEDKYNAEIIVYAKYKSLVNYLEKNKINKNNKINFLIKDFMSK